jgi:CheY-like chemotaxis protein
MTNDKTKILIIDDDPKVFWLINEGLGENYHIVSARDGKQGLDALFKDRPDLILLDIKMPGINGVQTFREVKKIDPRAAVIISAAFMDVWLRQLIADFMVDDSKAVDELVGTEDNIDRPLSSFSSRIRAAYCLGLIPRDEYDDLLMVRKLRNRFAHGMHGLSVDDDVIVSWCNELKIPKKIFAGKVHHWDTFLIAVSMLTSRLAIRAKGIGEKRLTVAQGFELTQVVRG